MVAEGGTQVLAAGVAVEHCQQVELAAVAVKALRATTAELVAAFRLIRRGLAAVAGEVIQLLLLRVLVAWLTAVGKGADKGALLMAVV